MASIGLLQIPPIKQEKRRKVASGFMIQGTGIKLTSQYKNFLQNEKLST